MQKMKQYTSAENIAPTLHLSALWLFTSFTMQGFYYMKLEENLNAMHEDHSYNNKSSNNFLDILWKDKKKFKILLFNKA